MRVYALDPADASGEPNAGAENDLRAIAEGNREALARLYHSHGSAVYAYALSILRHREEAEDVQQDTFVQIWRAAGTYRPQGKPDAWIFTIARNLAMQRLRERKKTVETIPEDWQEEFADDPRMDPSDRVLAAALLESLGDEERQIVVLHIMTGMKHQEIAEMMGKPLSTVLSKYNRALKKLRSAYKEADSL